MLEPCPVEWARFQHFDPVLPMCLTRALFRQLFTPLSREVPEDLFLYLPVRDLLREAQGHLEGVAILPPLQHTQLPMWNGDRLPFTPSRIYMVPGEFAVHSLP